MIELVFIGGAFVCLLLYAASACNFSYEGMLIFALAGFAGLVIAAYKLVERVVS